MMTDLLSLSIGDWLTSDNVPITSAAPAPPLRETGDEDRITEVAQAPRPTSILEVLAAAAAEGDIGARDRLLAEIRPLVLRYCRSRLGRQESVIGSADDVAQDVCLAVVSALPLYTLKGLSFRAFVYGIASHKVADAFRAIGRNRSALMADLPDAPAPLDGLEQRLLTGELTERLGNLLHLLTPRQRDVLVLRIAVGLSAQETAEVVGSTPGAVRVTQYRALVRLQKMFDDDTFAAPNSVHADASSDASVAIAYTDLVDDLAATILDLPAGSEDATRAASYTDLTDDLTGLLDLHAGLDAIIGQSIAGDDADRPQPRRTGPEKGST